MKIIKSQRGVAAVVEISVAVLVLAIVGSVIYRAVTRKPVQTHQTTPPPAAEPAPPAPVDPTAEWKAYSNSTGKFSLKFPEDWNAKICEPGAPDLYLYLGPTEASSVICGSEHGSQIIVGSSPNIPTASEQELGSHYGNIKITNIKADGVAGKRHSGTLKVPEDGLSTIPVGTKLVRYYFIKPGRSYILQYIQTPSGDYEADYLEEFDLMVQQTLKFE